ncbi:MAG TPA: hypothetical protein VKY73_07730 [Polyangiaceae bacterium]|nr:hypothetical protein [Polyangiaceae bacterium]
MALFGAALPALGQPSFPIAPRAPEAAPDTPRPVAETRAQARQRTLRLRQVSGTVIANKPVTVRGTDLRLVVVHLRTATGDRRLVLDLGPATRLAGIQVQRGQRLAAEGFVARVGNGEEVFVARRVRQGDHVVSIDRSGQVAHARKQRAAAREQSIR